MKKVAASIRLRRGGRIDGGGNLRLARNKRSG
jgi:hypothetical protein